MAVKSESKKEYEKAVELIVKLIKKNNLTLGSKLPTERTLATEFGMSRNSTREALRILENLGLLESRQGSGNFIKGDVSSTLSSMMEMMVYFNQFSFEEIYAFRSYMDKMVCSLLINQNKDLEYIVDEAEKILNSPAKTTEEEIERDKKFHYFLIDSTENKLLITLLRASSEVYHQIIDSVITFADENKKNQLFNAHMRIIDALRTKSQQMCNDAIDNHYLIAAGKDIGINHDATNINLEQERYDILIESFKMLNSLKKDNLTGLYTKEFFFRKAEEYINDHPDQNLMLWTSDIIGLNVINEKYGFDVGDEVIKKLAGGRFPFEGYLFGGRTEGDKLCALFIDNGFDLNTINAQLADISVYDMPISNILVKNGVYRIKKGDDLSIQAMYLRTILALKEIKDDYNIHVAEYDEKFRNELMINRQIVTDAKEALERGDFKVYFQPKIKVSESAVGGAEALVRWVHPELGFMNPGVFISIFEQNGFITNLDFYIWEEVCKIIKEWKSNGIPLVPVSVNVSRRDFETEDLAEKIIELVDRYEIEHNLFEIEITESSFINSLEKVENIVRKLHEAGFTISLDDFGTGYSSMIALSKLELDVLKLDMSMIQNDNQETKRNALDFSFQLAKMVNLRTVAEGIETEEQVQRIASLGGDYIQGFYYSKPIPKAEFEDYLKKRLV